MEYIIFAVAAFIIIGSVRFTRKQGREMTCNRCLRQGAKFLGSGWMGGSKVSRYQCKHCDNVIVRKIA